MVRLFRCYRFLHSAAAAECRDASVLSVPPVLSLACLYLHANACHIALAQPKTRSKPSSLSLSPGPQKEGCAYPGGHEEGGILALMFMSKTA